MDIGAALESRAQPAHLVKPRERALYHPTLLSQTRTVWRTASGDTRADATCPQPAPVPLGVVASVSQQSLRTPARASTLTAYRRHSAHQAVQLRGVVTVGRRDMLGQRHALSVGNDVVFAAPFAPIHGAWSCLLSCMDGTHRRRVDHSTSPVDTVRTAQPRQQLSMQPVPHARGLPVAKAPPACHAAYAHLDWQVLPLDAGLEHKDNAREATPWVCRLAPRVVPAPWFRRGQQRLNHCPEFVVDERPCHDETSLSSQSHHARRHLPCRHSVRAF